MFSEDFAIIFCPFVSLPFSIAVLTNFAKIRRHIYQEKFRKKFVQMRSEPSVY